MTTTTDTLTAALPPGADADTAFETFTDWVERQGISLYPAQEESLLEIFAGSNVVVATPTGSGKSLVALGAHLAAMADGRRSVYTAPIKALVSEKFFALCRQLGSDNVGMVTGDASVNPGAPVICCTAEILANRALREGASADVGQVVMDEFHFYAEPDRGWAWQLPLLELPQAQFILMSATLGDVTRFERELTERTGRPTATVTSVERPVPLDFEYRRTPLLVSIEELLETKRAPVYIVHFTQVSAAERAQSLMSVNMCTKEEKGAIAEGIGDFRFGPGFGKYLSRFIRHGIGVHHAGMLPKYRLLVEKLAQEGHLKVICGTDTLGVGINVPIRTVLLTQLYKYDGTSSRLLTAREFHQIAGRAGRAGYDTSGTVWVQAPEHVVANDQMVAKAGDDPKKKRKVVRKKPPTKGFVNWSDDTFERLVKAPPEQLTSSFAVSHSLMLNVLDRPGDGCAAARRILLDNHEPRARQRGHIRRAIAIYRSLLASGVVEQLDRPDPDGRRVRVTVDLQADFALNQPLSPFVLEAIGHLDAEEPTYALDVLSMVEATLENPATILRAQLDKLKGEVISDLKAQGMEYEERMEVLDTLEYPKPLRDLTYDLFNAYATQHPWVEDHNIKPKSVARDLYERAMTFAEYIDHYGLARSEGLVLRYLSDAWKGLVQNVPEEAKTDEVYDVTEWLLAMIRQVDSSLVDEWERMRHPEEVVDEIDAVAGTLAMPAEARLPDEPERVTANARGFRVMVRNDAFRRVELLARRRYGSVADLDGPGGLSFEELAAAMGPYWEEHETLGIGPDARGPALFEVEEHPEHWDVHQRLEDPAGDHDWVLHLRVDLAASDEEGHPVMCTVALGS
jgi:hypothetical protein